MAHTVKVKLIDDIDGGDADEMMSVSLGGKFYEIDLSPLRKAFKACVDAGRASRSGGGRRSPIASSGATLFSQLDSEEKDRFRAWAKMPKARRNGDARVQAWIDAGRPNAIR